MSAVADSSLILVVLAPKSPSPSPPPPSPCPASRCRRKISPLALLLLPLLCHSTVLCCSCKQHSCPSFRFPVDSFELSLAFYQNSSFLPYSVRLYSCAASTTISIGTSICICIISSPPFLSRFANPSLLRLNCMPIQTSFCPTHIHIVHYRPASNTSNSCEASADFLSNSTRVWKHLVPSTRHL
ncbi:hypothetical protein FPQ18DRAFT_156097 [Pyronema domesticum]|nr:hypothetical protein FPQ18DRAFT_156097 [Pyronema domesticum]